MLGSNAIELGAAGAVAGEPAARARDVERVRCDRRRGRALQRWRHVDDIDAADDGAARGHRCAGDVNVVDADPFVAVDSIAGQDTDLHLRLIVGGVRQRHVDGSDLRGGARSGGVGNEATGQIGPTAGITDAVLHGDLLNGVVGRAIDIADIELHAHVLLPAGVEIEDQARGIGSAGTIEGHDVIGEVKFGDSAGRECVRSSLIRVDINCAERRPGDRLRVDAGGRTGVDIAKITLNAGHARPIVVGRDRSRIAPILGQSAAGERMINGRHGVPPSWCRCAEVSPVRSRAEAADRRDAISSEARASGGFAVRLSETTQVADLLATARRCNDAVALQIASGESDGAWSECHVCISLLLRTLAACEICNVWKVRTVEAAGRDVKRSPAFGSRVAER